MESDCLDKKHILVVDDNPNLLMTYRLILEMQGYRSSAASNAMEAREALGSYHIDLVLCDLTLGRGEDGCEVITSARSLQPNIAAALLTGHQSPKLEAWASDNDVMLLQKPANINVFLQAVALLTNSPSDGRRTA
jgi:DNA-binding NtrC family response regulator